jgi:hypothetical protein
VKQGPEPPTMQSLSAKIPPNVKQAILDSLKASYRPTTDDKQGGFHEEGGIWVTTTNGDVVAEPALPGKYAKPGDPAHMQVKDAVIAIMATLAKQERIKRAERTRAGLARVRAAGRRLGRPTMLNGEHHAAVRRLRAAGESFRAIAQQLGISDRSARRLAAAVA